MDKINFNKLDKQHESFLSKELEQEILRREKEFKEGRIKSKPWEEVKKRFALDNLTQKDYRNHFEYYSKKNRRV